MTSSTEECVTALYDYTANDPEELTIHKNEQLSLLDNTGMWFKVRNRHNSVGLVPSNYVKVEKNKGNLVNRIANKFPGKKTKHLPATGFAKNEPNPSSGVGSDTMSDYYVVKFPYDGQKSDELKLVKGMQITVIAKEEDGWWQGRGKGGNVGWFPSNYVEPMVNQSVSPASKGCMHVVKAIYPFSTTNEEELSFSENERMDVISTPANDPEWYEARNASGNIGLIPKTYVEILQNAPSVFQPELRNYDDVLRDNAPSNGVNSVKQQDSSESYLAGKPWYVGDMTRQSAESLLNSKARNCEFIIRNSESTVGDFSISMKAPDKIKHFKVSLKEKKFCIGQRKFDTLENLIDHYRKAPIYTTLSGDKMFLGQPLPK